MPLPSTLMSALACMNRNVGYQISNSERILVLYAAVNMVRYILDAESANSETPREGGGSRNNAIPIQPPL